MSSLIEKIDFYTGVKKYFFRQTHISSFLTVYFLLFHTPVRLFYDTLGSRIIGTPPDPLNCLLITTRCHYRAFISGCFHAWVIFHLFFFHLCAYALGWISRALWVCDQCLSISSFCVWASLYACACMTMCVHLHLKVFVVWNQRRIFISLRTLIRMFCLSVIIWPYGQRHHLPFSYTHTPSGG